MFNISDGIEPEGVVIMNTQTKILSFNQKDYEVDGFGFLINPDIWDEDFANGIAIDSMIPNGLSEKHWKIIHFIREKYHESNDCPNIYTTCRANELKLQDLCELFPTGYHRGACKIAGISYREGYVAHYYWDNVKKAQKHPKHEKVYHVDINGFLVNFDEWDEAFANSKAIEMKMPELLTETHWNLIKYLRDYYSDLGSIPNVFETCRHFNIELEELEQLFPDGYHRGAIKIAGLRME